MRPKLIIDQLYEVELVKSELEHREPIIVRFFILQYAKLRMLELYYFPKNELNGTRYVLKTALTTLLRMQPTFFSPELAVMSIRNMIRESRDY